MIEDLAKAILAALIKEAPAAVVGLLRSAGVLGDGDDTEHAAKLLRAADIMGDVNPMKKVRRS